MRLWEKLRLVRVVVSETRACIIGHRLCDYICRRALRIYGDRCIKDRETLWRDNQRNSAVTMGRNIQVDGNKEERVVRYDVAADVKDHTPKSTTETGYGEQSPGLRLVRPEPLADLPFRAGRGLKQAAIYRQAGESHWEA